LIYINATMPMRGLTQQGTTDETMGRSCWSSRHWNASTCPKRCN